MSAPDRRSARRSLALCVILACELRGLPATANDSVDYVAAIERFAHSDSAALTPDWPLPSLEWLEHRTGFLLAASTIPLCRSAVIMHLTAATRASLRGQQDVTKAHLLLARKVLPLAAPQNDDQHAAAERVALRRAVPLVEAYILMRQHLLQEALAVLEPMNATDDAHWQLAIGMCQELLANSPQLLAAETRADPAADAILANRRRWVGRHDALVLEQRQRLEAAERSLSAAISLAPALQEARLRLARTRSLLGQTEQAEAEWTELLRAGAEAPTACMARLFLGKSAASRGAWREAIAQDRAGIGLCPQAQSLRLALSDALLGAGDGDGARREARAASELQPTEVDPWLRYNAEPQRGIAELIAELRLR